MDYCKEKSERFVAVDECSKNCETMFEFTSAQIQLLDMVIAILDDEYYNYTAIQKLIKKWNNVHSIREKQDIWKEICEVDDSLDFKVNLDFVHKTLSCINL